MKSDFTPSRRRRGPAGHPGGPSKDTGFIHIKNPPLEGQHYEADIARVLHPLPRRPLRVRCWKPDDGMASDLQLFFDNDDRRRARR